MTNTTTTKPAMPKHADRVKTIASGKRGGLKTLVLTSYGGKRLVCSSELLAVALKGKLPTLGGDIEAYRWAELPKEAAHA